MINSSKLDGSINQQVPSESYNMPGYLHKLPLFTWSVLSLSSGTHNTVSLSDTDEVSKICYV